MSESKEFKADSLEKVRNAVNVCTMCGFCKSVCPSFKSIGWDSALSRGRIVLTYGLLTGELFAAVGVTALAILLFRIRRSERAGTALAFEPA